MSRDKLWPEYEGDNEVVSESRVGDAYVDRLEGDLDRELGEGFDSGIISLEIWLKGSEDSENGDELEKLSQIRQALKNADDVAVPESGVYFDAFEARIMGALDAAIENGEVQDREIVEDGRAAVTMGNPVHEVFARMMSERRRSMAIRVGQFAVLAGVTFLMAGKWLINPSETGGETTVASELRAAHQAAPQVLTRTVMTFESGSDLAMEIAVRRIAARKIAAR